MNIETDNNCIVCGREQLFKFRQDGYSYHRCKSCGLLSTYPTPKASDIEEHYSKRFEDGNYRLAQEFMAYYLDVYKGYVRQLERRSGEDGLHLRGSKILDIGCFTGELLELLHEKGADVYGLELQDKAREVANNRLPGRVFKADVFSNNFPQTEFDMILLMGLIEHVVDPIKLLTQAVRFLKPGGLLMLQTPASDSGIAKIMGRYWPPCAPVEHIHLFSVKSLRLLLGELGLEDIKVRHHWKKLPIAYLCNNLQYFGGKIYNRLEPCFRLLPGFITRRSVPFCIGEVVVLARKEREAE